MRGTKLTAIATALVCGSVTLGVTGPALAAGRAAEHAAAVEHAAAADVPVDSVPGADSRSDSIGSLGETLNTGSRIVKEAESWNPDMEHLRDLRVRLRESAERLLADVRAVKAKTPARPGTDGLAVDPVSDVKSQLDTLVKDVNDLLAAVQAKDVGKVTALVGQVTADLQALLTSVPKLLSNAAPLPAPLPAPVPLPGL
ncbi:hypothetical protein [Streptomyces sp. UNOB3_S3]|uniref:hypothetical protein n=1 Tax=Streptomyces sp. UNOB3_S3 TaxID=2871682 RepID=UPI001E57A91F|nr:hypothetical protein [Streptomyces sp. UNOB3_S3]MCC3778363.1 hypothetical protein [Streptomyces sp. UNOB3_S3]